MRKYSDQCTEVALRYLPVVHILRQAGVGKVLEVGSGSLGLTPYSGDFSLTGLDQSFEQDNPGMKQVSGSALTLPFEDRSFDAVISVDSLEHIPPGEREAAVTELIRTAYGLAVIAVPTGTAAEAQDRFLSERYRQVRGEDYPFFQDHLTNGLPGADALEQMVTRCLTRLGRSGTLTLHKNSNLRLRAFLMKGWISNNRFYHNLAVLGLMPFSGILSRLNYGGCYRTIAVIDLSG